MKYFAFAAVTLALLTGAVIANCFFVSRTCEDILEMIDEMPASPSEKAYSDAEKIEKFTESKEFNICLSVGHRETEEIFMRINELKIRSGGNENDYLLAIAALRDCVSDLLRSESISLKGIL